LKNNNLNCHKLLAARSARCGMLKCAEG
jgi:hypothetical protein